MLRRHAVPCPLSPDAQLFEPMKTPHDAQHQGHGVARQHPLADVAAIGDPDPLRQARPQPNFDTDSGELDPFQGLTFVTH